MIAWRESAGLLRRCLRALAGQGADQIIVSRSSEAEFSESLESEFPDVQWISRAGASDLPELQWPALTEVKSDLTAFLEAPSLPGPGWVAAHRQAHLAHAEVLACGGPVRPPQTAKVWALGWHWSDYAAYAPGRTSGVTRDLTDANVSYKTGELLAYESLLAEAAWGWRIRQASTLPAYYESPAWIDYPCPHSLAGAMDQRCLAGRDHGAVGRPGISRRLWPVVAAPLKPIVLAWRGWRHAQAAAYGSRYAVALPWVIAFHACWTYGELIGLLTGRRSRYCR